MRVLRKLHDNGHNEEWLQSEFAEIRATISAEKAITTRGWKIMFTVPQWRMRLLHGTLIQVFTQLTGISRLRFYRRVEVACADQIQMSLATTKPSCMPLSVSLVNATCW